MHLYTYFNGQLCNKKTNKNLFAILLLLVITSISPKYLLLLIYNTFSLCYLTLKF
uniref:Uncharacterized protein n=1 Tax=Manihot esculenta TaxID=3983 RepID=A0A2C9WGJ8_MANES